MLRTCGFGLAIFAATANLAAPDPGLERLTARMTGSFSSAAQSETDERFRDVRLHVSRIWPERSDAVWLYVEQAMADRLDAPYRQRVYRLTRSGEESFVSAVYELAEPAAAVGAWKLERPLADLAPEALVVRPGCAVTLREDPEGTFSGSTAERQCASALRGASWASSEVRIDANGMTSWDRGFDAEGRQVWGSEAGPYRFVREAR